MLPPLRCVVGPTGSGKSRVAFRVAAREGAILLSVDAMQVYRGLDIGTAKAGAVERAQVRHEGIDLIEASGSMSAGTFSDHVHPLLDEAAVAGVPVVAAGGSGLYLRAIVRGLGPQVPADPTLRASLHQEEADRPGALRDRLAVLDPRSHLRLHPNDRVRIERAVEVALLTGRPLSLWLDEHQQSPSRHPAVFVGLRWSRDALRARIEARLAAMWEVGWVDEVLGLLDRGVPADAPGLRAIGYREIVALLRGEADERATRQAISCATHDYAKRQGTWFRGMKEVVWVDVQDDGDLDRVEFPRGE